jgi:hypothetical protein
MKHHLTPYMQYSYSLPPKHHLQLQNVSEVAPCPEELNVHKMSGNWGILLK